MTGYADIVEGYKKRQKDTVIDVISTGLTYVDEIAVDTGILEETGLMTELLETVGNSLPFAIIAISEGSKVLLGNKTLKSAGKDCAFRMIKSGAAIGAGTVVLGTAGLLPAIPVTMGVRAIFDHYKSKTLTGRRVNGRIERLKEINMLLKKASDNENDAQNEEKADVGNITVEPCGTEIKIV